MAPVFCPPPCFWRSPSVICLIKIELHLIRTYRLSEIPNVMPTFNLSLRNCVAPSLTTARTSGTERLLSKWSSLAEKKLRTWSVKHACVVRNGAFFQINRTTRNTETSQAGVHVIIITILLMWAQKSRAPKTISHKLTFFKKILKGSQRPHHKCGSNARNRCSFWASITTFDMEVSKMPMVQPNNQTQQTCQRNTARGGQRWGKMRKSTKTVHGPKRWRIPTQGSYITQTYT